MTRTDAIAAFAEVLDEEIHRQSHMTTRQMYDHVKRMLPDLCDDSIRCVHRGQDYGQPEWKHQVRNAQQTLKREGRAYPTGRSWVAKEPYRDRNH